MVGYRPAPGQQKAEPKLPKRSDVAGGGVPRGPRHATINFVLSIEPTELLSKVRRR
jgi:hypothetical protein